MRPISFNSAPWFQAGGLVGDVQAAVTPANADFTVANASGYQMLGWGVGVLVAPAWMMATVFGVSGLSPADANVLRSLSVLNLLLGAKVCRGSDRDAVADGFLFFGA